MMLAYGQGSVVCLDSTHNTCFGFEKAEKVWLYTLVVRSTTTGRGIPAGFMFTNAEHAQPIIYWLECLRRDPRLRFKPSHFMIDCFTTELLAIRTAFTAPSTPSVLFCDWHMLKAMTANSKLKVKGHEGHPQGALRNQDNQLAQKEARSGFLKLVNASDPQAVAEELARYLERWKCCPAWTKYVEEQWLPYKELWGRAWRREAHRGIDTNNFIETWHNQLKTAYLGMMRKQGVDVLLCILLKQCVPDYRSNELRVSLGLDSCAMTKADREARRKAQDLPYLEALALVEEAEGGSITVESFSVSGQRYRLRTRLDALGDEVELVGCSCFYFQQREFPCKHMWLANRVLSLPLAQFSRKIKASVTDRAPAPAPSAAPSAAAGAPAPPSAAPPPAAGAPPAAAASVSAAAALASAVAATEASAANQAMRAERDQILAAALPEIGKIFAMGDNIRRQVDTDAFSCSRQAATDLVSRLEVVQHIMVDVLQGRQLHHRQQVSAQKTFTTTFVVDTCIQQPHSALEEGEWRQPHSSNTVRASAGAAIRSPLYFTFHHKLDVL
ncbi:hypothetical protein A4X06_0g2797 [Tilletia controversa]|uniref:SWIM-type domain-containing protein n=1 Tax=Tilletia controversa TaxID=13291 RepID=A0A8X7SYE6_9BASI|nr:hypothetical protein A4X06_0g2797 [Tilletia controversa]